MKNFLITVSFALGAFGILGLNSASTLAFPLEGAMTITPGAVQVVYCNPLAVAIECQVSDSGVIENGLPLDAWANLTLLPGECQSTFVSAPYPSYFVQGAYSDDCGYL